MVTEPYATQRFEIKTERSNIKTTDKNANSRRTLASPEAGE
jgi:hypothetical protein